MHGTWLTITDHRSLFTLTLKDRYLVSDIDALFDKSRSAEYCNYPGADSGFAQLVICRRTLSQKELSAHQLAIISLMCCHLPFRFPIDQAYLDYDRQPVQHSRRLTVRSMRRITCPVTVCSLKHTYFQHKLQLRMCHT